MLPPYQKIVSFDPFNVRPFYVNKVREFDPFKLARSFEWSRKHSSWWLLGLAPVCLVIVAAGALLAGRFGTIRDTRMIWLDIQASIGIEASTEFSPNFTFMRDATTWFLISVIVLTCMLVHRQWKLMRSALPELAAYGALKPLIDGRRIGRRRRDRWTRRLKLEEIIETQDSEEYLNAVVDRVDRILAKNFALGFAVAAFFLAFVPVGGSFALGIYGAFAPSEVPADEVGLWAKDAYDSWWAGIRSDGLRWLFGTIAYVAVASLGIYVILLQNFVGVLAVYIVLCIPRVTLVDADWLNRDGRFGWSPIGRIFRTVYLSLALHGLSLSVLLITFGIDHSPLLIVLIGIWVVVTPLYLIVPLVVFRRISRSARKRRLDDLAKMMKSAGIDLLSDGGRLGPCIFEIERVNNARIQPLRMGRLEIPALVVIVLPIVIAVAQTVFQVQFTAAG